MVAGIFVNEKSEEFYAYEIGAKYRDKIPPAKYLL